MAQVGPIKQRDKTITPDKNTFSTKDQKLFADHAPCDMIHKPLLAKILAVKALNYQTLACSEKENHLLETLLVAG